MDQVALLQTFRDDLRACLGAELAEISFDALWLSDPPEEAEGKSLGEYMIRVSQTKMFKTKSNL